MAVITTYALVAGEHRRVPLAEYGVADASPVDNSPPVPPVDITANGYGTITDVPITEIEEAFTAWKAPSFLDDFYYRVHIRPGVIVLGNLLSTQVRTVE